MSLQENSSPVDPSMRSVAAQQLFPGRTALLVEEVAAALSCTERHVLNLIHQYEMTGGEAGLKGFSIARTIGGKPSRKAWRIAVSDYEAFLARHQQSHSI